MAKKPQVFRIFVSSTFNDLKKERNALQTYVFPRLRAFCQRHGAQFQPIDLRWGVSDEASLDQQSMNICLGEVNRCQKISPRPNFIILLGDRYGWMPPPAQIPENEFRSITNLLNEQEKEFLEEWYLLDTNAVPPERRLKPRVKNGPYESYGDWQPVEVALQGILSRAIEKLPLDVDRKPIFQASATHQEILAGALDPVDAPEHVFCFFRDIQNLPMSFNKEKYDVLLNSRIHLEFPRDLTKESAELSKIVKMLPAGTSAAELQKLLLKMQNENTDYPKNTRVIQFMQQVLTDITARDYINLEGESWDVDKEAAESLHLLKSKLRQKFSSNFFHANEVQWLGGTAPTKNSPYHLISDNHIGSLPETLDACLPLLDMKNKPANLCEAVFQSLGRVIRAEIKQPHTFKVAHKKQDHINQNEFLDEEGLIQHAFAENRLEFFVGRKGILEKIGAFLTSGESKMLAIIGKGGTGKSALMAKAVEQAQQAHPSAVLIYRFIGASADSSDGRSLLESVCHEISRCYGADISDIPSDFQSLVPEFMNRLGLASVKKPLVLFIDSLDQLSGTHDARRLRWLPEKIPENVSMVISSRPEKDVYSNLKEKAILEIPLGGLDEKDGRLMLNKMLNNVHRQLTKTQENEVISKFIASEGNPLYMKLAFEEARLWTSFEKSQEKLAIDIRGIIKENMIQRLADEGNHGNALVSHALGYLAASRHGLAEDELVDLLSRDYTVYAWFFSQSYHLPSDLIQMAITYLAENPQEVKDFHPETYTEPTKLAMDWLKKKRTPTKSVEIFLKQILKRIDGPRLPIVLWSRLSFALTPYMADRLVDGKTLKSFYHRELGDISKELFLGENDTVHFHHQLADYFRSKADPSGNASWDGSDNHALSELPHHLIAADEQDQVFSLLTDFNFLERKAEEVGITRKEDGSGGVEIFSEGIQNLMGDFDEALKAFFPQVQGGKEDGGMEPLIRTVMKSRRKLIVFCPTCGKESAITQKEIGQVITCPNESCTAKLKLNPFTIQAD